MNWVSRLLGKRDPESSAHDLNEGWECYRKGDLQSAERLGRALLESEPEDARILRLLGEIAYQRQDDAAAADWFGRARNAGERDRELAFKLAVCLQNQGRLDDAEIEYRHVLELEPRHFKALGNLGRILEQRGDFEAAYRCYAEAVEAAPEVPLARRELARLLARQGKVDEACAAWRAALHLAPERLDWAVELSAFLLEQGRYAEAAQELQAVLARDAALAAAHELLGRCYVMLGEPERAEECCRNALRLDPKCVDAAFRLSGLLFVRRLLDEAESLARMVIELLPNMALAHGNLGDILMHRGDFEGAKESYLRALELDPELEAKVGVNLGSIYQKEARLDAAAEAFRRVLEKSPQDRGAYNNLGNILYLGGDLERGMDCYRKALELSPEFNTARSNLLMVSHYANHDPATLYREHLEFQRQLPPFPAVPPFANLPQPDRKLRVGYVSPDFRQHSVAFFIEPILASHDRARFEVHCYSNVLREDDVTERLRDVADCWTDVMHLSDDEAAEVIRADGIDILVDLAGHTDRNRLLLFARRAAPVQVTYLGYPNTTGLEAMDYRLTDAVADPQGVADALHSERLVRLESGFLCYRPPRGAVAEPGEPPLLKRGYATFGSFNNLAKVSDEMLGLWVRLLERVPGSRLLLKALGLGSEAASRRFLERLAAAGGVPERVDIRAWTVSLRDHLETYHDVDVALDVYPYNGTTTTCEALWMGVPVVTWAGSSHVSRVGASILTRVGATEWVAARAEEYLELAAGLVRCPERLTELRRELRARVEGSALCDEAAVTRAIESAYRRMWCAWCDSQVRP